MIRDEPETPALRRFVDGAELVSCDLVITELPRAIRRAVVRNPKLPGDVLIRRVEDLLEAIALRPLDRGLLVAAGALAEPALRSLDAIHVAAAVDLVPHDGIVSYDVRQSAVARLEGLRTFAPGG